LMKNPGLANSLANGPYHAFALVPPSPWLDITSPGQPELSVRARSEPLLADWDNRSGAVTRWWLLQYRLNGTWMARLFPAAQSGLRVNDFHPDAMVLRAVSRTGMVSRPAVWMRP